MKNLLVLTGLLVAFTAYSQNLKPYVLGSSSNQSVTEAKDQVIKSLENSNFKIVGEYMPADDANRYLILVNHSALNKAVKTVGGLTGFASVMRVAITKESGVTNVSYTNPSYWGNAYFRDDYQKVKPLYVTVESDFRAAMAKLGNEKGIFFGSKEGESADDLQEYHYMFGMPYFDETVQLRRFSSSDAATSVIDKALKSGKPGIKQVYRHTVPGTNLVLYGIALDDEKSFMPIIDISSPKHTAFLPYEVLVMDGQVHMLHGRYRIALSFPDLTMGTFTQIMSTPGDIEDAMMQLVE